MKQVGRFEEEIEEEMARDNMAFWDSAWSAIGSSSS